MRDYFDTSTAGVQAFALMNSAQVRLIYIQGVHFLNCTNWLTKKNGQVIPFRTCLPPLKIGWTGKISWQLHLFSHLTTSTSGPAPLVVCWYQPKGWTNERTTMQKSQTFRFASKILKGMHLGVVIKCIFLKNLGGWVEGRGTSRMTLQKTMWCTVFAGLSDVPGEAMVKLYCPKCQDAYTPKSSRHHHTDGAYFGTGFPHMLFMVHPEYRPKRPANQFVPRCAACNLKMKCHMLFFFAQTKCNKQSVCRLAIV